LKGSALTVTDEFLRSMDGAAAFNALVERYELKGEAQKAVTLSKINALSFTEGGNPGITFDKAEEYRRQIKERFGENLDDAYMLSQFINKIPIHTKMARSTCCGWENSTMWNSRGS